MSLTTCKLCNKNKIRKLKKVYTNGSMSYYDSNGKRWNGKICPCCERKRRRKKHAESGGRSLQFINCIICSGRFKQKTIWNNTCKKCQPIATKIRAEKINKKKQLNTFRKCVNCSKSFVPKLSGYKKYCSQKCKHPLRHCKSCNVKINDHGRTKCSNCRGYKKVKHRDKSCLCCGSLFVPKTNRSKYCHKRCTPSYRNAKIYRKSVERCKEQKISKHYKKEITQIYKDRPEGCHVDHIIPLKGENVCGLHVPWNLQYLQALENIKKGNKT